MKAKWNFKDNVDLHKPAEIPSSAARQPPTEVTSAPRLTSRACLILGSCKSTVTMGCPDLRDVEHLPRGMPKDKVITALALLSCIGMIQNSLCLLLEAGRVRAWLSHYAEASTGVAGTLQAAPPAITSFYESVPYKTGCACCCPQHTRPAMSTCPGEKA